MRLSFTIEHIGLAARDTTLLKEWYTNTLGATVALVIEQTPPAYLLEMPGGLMIEIYPAHESSEDVQNNRLNGWRHLALKVASIEEARRRLENSGVRFEELVKQAGGGGRVLFFKDPEGNLLHLVERSPDFRKR